MKCGLISSLLGELGGGWVERWHLWAMVSHITVTLGCVWGTAAVNDESHPVILLGSAYYPHWLAIVLEEKICLLRMMCMTSLALALPPCLQPLLESLQYQVTLPGICVCPTSYWGGPFLPIGLFIVSPHNRFSTECAHVR